MDNTADNTKIFIEKDFVEKEGDVLYLEIPESIDGDVCIDLSNTDLTKLYHIDRKLNKKGNTELFVAEDLANATIVVSGNGDGDLFREGGNGHTMLKSNGTGNVFAKGVIYGSSIRSGDGDGNADLISEKGFYGSAIKFGNGIGSAVNNCDYGFAFREDLGVGNSEFYGTKGISYHGPLDEEIFENLLSEVRNPMYDIKNKKLTMPTNYNQVKNRENKVIEMMEHNNFLQIMEKYENKWEVAAVKDYKSGGHGNAIMNYNHTGRKGDVWVKGCAIRFGGGQGDSIYSSVNDRDMGHRGMSIRFGVGKGDALCDGGKSYKGGPGFGVSSKEVTTWMKFYGNDESRLDKMIESKRKQLELASKRNKQNDAGRE